GVPHNRLLTMEGARCSSTHQITYSPHLSTRYDLWFKQLVSVLGVFQMPGDGAEKGRRRGAVDDAMVKGQTEEQHRPLGDLALVDRRLLDHTPYSQDAHLGLDHRIGHLALMRPQKMSSQPQ